MALTARPTLASPSSIPVVLVTMGPSAVSSMYARLLNLRDLGMNRTQLEIDSVRGHGRRQSSELVRSAERRTCCNPAHIVDQGLTREAQGQATGTDAGDAD